MYFQHTFEAIMWAQPMSELNPFEEGRSYVGCPGPSKVPFYQISQYKTFQNTRQKQQQPIINRGFIFDYCENTSLHGMKYIAQRDRRWYER
jgi:hypothetical protein